MSWLTVDDLDESEWDKSLAEDLDNVSAEELLSESVQHPAGYRFASLKLLRKMKLASGRSKDLLDLEMLPQA